MKKVLSLILAAILCAATVTVSAAAEVTETVAEEEVVYGMHIIPYHAEVIVAFASTKGLLLTPEFVDAAMIGERSRESVLTLAEEYELVFTEEQVLLLIDILNVFGATLFKEVPADAAADRIVGEASAEEKIDLAAALADPAVYEIVFSIAPDAVMASDTDILLPLVEVVLLSERNNIAVDVPAEDTVIVKETIAEDGFLEETPTFGLLTGFPMPAYKYLIRG